MVNYLLGGRGLIGPYKMFSLSRTIYSGIYWVLLSTGRYGFPFQVNFRFEIKNTPVLDNFNLKMSNLSTEQTACDFSNLSLFARLRSHKNFVNPKIIVLARAWDSSFVFFK